MAATTPDAAQDADGCACCPQPATSEKLVLGHPGAVGTVVAPLCDACAPDRTGPHVYYADLPTGGDA